MLTKKNIADLVIETLLKDLGPNGDPDRIDEREVWKQIDLIASNYINQYVATTGLAQLIESGWVKRLKAQILWNDEQKECYLELPASPVNLLNDAAIRGIEFMQGGDSQVRLLQDGQWQSVKVLAGNTDNTTWYAEHSGNRFNFKRMNKTMEGTEVIVRMICDSGGYADNEPIPLPPGMEEVVYTKVLTIMQPKLKG